MNFKQLNQKMANLYKKVDFWWKKLMFLWSMQSSLKFTNLFMHVKTVHSFIFILENLGYYT